MRVILTKKHLSWDVLYPGELNVGDEMDIEKNIVTTKSGKQFSAIELTKSFSNHHAYPDIFRIAKITK